MMIILLFQACAPRYIYRGRPPNPEGDLQYRWPLGKCFLISADLAFPTETREPCFDGMCSLHCLFISSTLVI